MWELLSLTGFLGIFVFLVLTGISALKRNGKWKKNLIIAGICFVLFMVGAINMETEEDIASQNEQGLDTAITTGTANEDNTKEDINNTNHDVNTSSGETSTTKNESGTPEVENTSPETDVPDSNQEENASETNENTANTDNELKSSKEVTGNLVAHYIDVGQGDTTLLLGPDFTILVDAGRHDRNDVIPYLQSEGIEKIDLFILTHPHADHIGQADKVLEEFTVEEVWASENEATSRTFERVLDAIIESGASYVEPKAGEEYSIGAAEIIILHPGDSLSGDLNDDSVSFRLDYGDVTFLFTGDAEINAEQQMIRSGIPLKAHILQVGHHGSSTSSSEAFLEQVKPEVAIYSAGKDNSYGHPHTEVVERYKRLGIELYGTDVNGTVIVTTDGKTYYVNTEKNGVVTAVQDSSKEPDEQLKSENITDSCGPGQVNVNSADLEDLKKIIHINESRGSEIIKLRETRAFTKIDDLERVRGIASARVKDIKEQGLACAG